MCSFLVFFFNGAIRLENEMTSKKKGEKKKIISKANKSLFFFFCYISVQMALIIFSVTLYCVVYTLCMYNSDWFYVLTEWMYTYWVCLICREKCVISVNDNIEVVFENYYMILYGSHFEVLFIIWCSCHQICKQINIGEGKSMERKISFNLRGQFFQEEKIGRF